MDETNSDLEISDLPGGRERRRPRMLAFVGALASRPRLRARLWRAATVALALVFLFVALPGNLLRLQEGFSSLFARSNPTPTTVSHHGINFNVQDITSQYDTKKVLVWNASTPPVVSPSTALAPAPQTCLQYTPLQAFDAPSYSPGVGGAPAWVTGFSGSAGQPAVLRVYRGAQPSQDGWIQQLQLVAATNFPGTITLQGGVANSGLPLWFATKPLDNLPHTIDLTDTISVNSLDTSVSNHTTDDQAWTTFPIDLYVAEAGCYYLTASWDGGTWTAYFAAGR